MANILFQTDSEFKPDSLIVSTKVGLITKGVKLAPKQGILKRGSLIGKATDGLYYLTGTDKEGIVGADGILTDDTDTGGDSAVDEVITTQYITGHFNKKALYVASSAKIEDYEEKLRTLGIFLENTI